jgi:hypothetical protein
MVKRINCWEFMQCGKGPGGNGNSESALCPVARQSIAGGFNHGFNGGRICWLIADRQCNETLVCSPEQDSRSCDSCEFHARVKSEEGLRDICRNVGDFIIETANHGSLQD